MIADHRGPGARSSVPYTLAVSAGALHSKASEGSDPEYHSTEDRCRKRALIVA